MGLAVDEKSKLIYVPERGNINVFSITREYIDRFCVGQVKRPYGIVISGDGNEFVSDCESHCVYKFELAKFQLVTKVGKQGTGVREFNYPRYLTVNTYRSVLVADCYNDRIVEMDTDLKRTR